MKKRSPAVCNAKVVEDYLETEVKLGRVVGPVVSHFGVIPKGHQTGRWRLILDLSHPEGRSVNDGIEPELCSLSYSSVDKAVRLIREKGTGAQLAKLDLESAYRMIPVHPDDRLLLGMEGATIYRYCIAIWATFSTKGVHSSGGCTDVDISQVRGVCRASLFR